MKSFGIIAALLLVAVVGINGKPDRNPLPQVTEQKKKDIDECRTELGLTDEEVSKLFRNRYDGEKENMNCIYPCLMKKDGFLEENKKLNIEKMVEAAVQMFEAEPVKAKEIIEECAEKAEDTEDECDFAEQVHKCIHREMRREFKRHGRSPKGPHGPKSEEMRKKFEECREELGITEEEEKEMHRRDEPDEKMRCMPACLMKKDGFLGADRKINIEKMLEVHMQRHPNRSTEGTEEIFEKCAKEAENEAKDECDVARNFFHCQHMNKPRRPHN